MPFSAGPTLLAAPSPIAWQGRHLLNTVLPASASCAPAGIVLRIENVASAAATNFRGMRDFSPWRGDGVLPTPSWRVDKYVDRSHKSEVIGGTRSSRRCEAGGAASQRQCCQRYFFGPAK